MLLLLLLLLIVVVVASFVCGTTFVTPFDPLSCSSFKALKLCYGD